MSEIWDEMMKEKNDSTGPTTKEKENVFEVDRIRELVRLMEEHDLSEIDLRESRHRIRICRGPQLSLVASPQAGAVAGPAYSSPAAAAAPAAGGTPAAPSNIGYVKSPMVGTFYSRPNPKSEPYVKVGDQIDASSIVCIIEAMKVFNEIPAEVSGKVVEIMVQDGESVDFEKPLYKVELNK